MKNKKTIIPLIVLFVSSFAFGQIVNIPDANFKAALLAGNTTNLNYVYDFPSDGPSMLEFAPGFDIDINNDGEIQVSEAENITGLFLDNSSILSLEGISAFTNLASIECNNNNISGSLDLSSNINLEYASFNNNLIQNINVSNCSNLKSISCENNQLLDLDLSNNFVLTTIRFVDNDFLQTINMKNGLGQFIDFPFSSWTLNNIQFICADLAEVDFLNNAFIAEGITVNINDYCSFIPGGDYNTISGSVNYDDDANGCDASDLVFPFLKLNIDSVAETGSTFTSNTGDYNFYTQDGNFTVTPDIENPTFFNVTPINVAINFPDTNNNIATQDFCISANGIHNDVEIVMAPTQPARPGFDAEYLLTYKNKGNQTLSGNFNFNYDDSVLDYVSSTVVPITQTTGILTWDYTNLLPFESRSVYVTLNVNSPQEIPAINIDDQLDFSATINPITGDELPNDNVFDYKQIVVGAFDPNDITCIEGDVLEPTEIGEYLHYIINFENTGNADAQNIVVATEINPAMFDISTLRLLSSSHDAYVKVTGDIVEIIFESIYLSSGGHGNILLKVQSQDTIEINDTVTKNAEIFFDYNFPIETNDANTTYAVLSTTEFDIDQSVSVYPNPVKNVVTILAKENITSITLFDVSGRLLQTKLNSSLEVKLDLSNRASGVYFIKIQTEKGIKVEKILKN